MTATPLPVQQPPGGPCPHIHTTGMHCPDPAGHDYAHDLAAGCTDCNIPEPDHNPDSYRGFLCYLFDAHGAPFPDPRILGALTEALGAAYGWGWDKGYDDGYDEGANAALALGDPEDNPQ